MTIHFLSKKVQQRLESKYSNLPSPPELEIHHLTCYRVSFSSACIQDQPGRRQWSVYPGPCCPVRSAGCSQLPAAVWLGWRGQQPPKQEWSPSTGPGDSSEQRTQEGTWWSGKFAQLPKIQKEASDFKMLEMHIWLSLSSVHTIMVCCCCCCCLFIKICEFLLDLHKFAGEGFGIDRIDTLHGETGKGHYLSVNLPSSSWWQQDRKFLWSVQ